jgi:RNA polymerase sigma-70 factor (ECF subfamily)
MQKESSPIPTDETLMERLVGGDESAFDELSRRFETRLYYFSWRHVRESEVAKDLVQDTLLRVWRHKNEFRQGSRLSTWIFAINLNLCRDYLRKNGRLSSMERPEVALAAEMTEQRKATPNALDEAERHQMVSLLGEALDALPPLQAKLIRLRNAEDISFEEAGERLGISPAAARAAASRAYKKLTGWMQKRVKGR